MRGRFFDFLRRLPGFTINVVIARKKPAIFARKHNNNPTEFYYDLLHQLLRGRLGQQAVPVSHIYLAQRGSNNTDRFRTAVAQAIAADATVSPPTIISPKCQPILSSECPELSVVDYCLWALQRYVLGGEIRFFAAMEAKFDLIVDLYDDQQEGGRGIYSAANPFRLEKCSPFEAVVK